MRWREEMAEAIGAFESVAKLAGSPITYQDILVEFNDAAHKPPTLLPPGKMAIYGFHWNGIWLKIGKAGPKSQPRYTSQHYNPMSARSTLAASLLRDRDRIVDFEAYAARPGDWIRQNCCRVNILLSASHGTAVLSLLEAFLHVRLKPRYEG